MAVFFRTVGEKLAVCMCIMASFKYGDMILLRTCTLITLSHYPDSFKFIHETSTFKLVCSGWMSSIPSKDDDFDKHIVNEDHWLNITSLEFPFNQIEVIPAFNISFASHVTNISFAHNQIKNVTLSVFLTFKNLKNLNLSSNFISNSGSESIFASIPTTVTTLDLSSNPISLLTEVKLNKLEKLYMSNCSISTISEVDFLGMTHLTYLDLSHNLLGTFDPGFLLSLEYLDLSNNALTAVPILGSETKTLLLSNNKIDSIPEDSFYSMGDVYLSLAFNRLTNITKANLPLRRFNLLELQGNPWDCCKLRWMTSPETKKLKETKHFVLHCKNPPELENRDIFTLNKDQLSCKMRSRHTMLLVVFCGILACFLVIGAGFILYRKRRKLRVLTMRATGKGYTSGRYVAVYSQNISEEDTNKVAISDGKPLVSMANNTATMIDV